jgi:hypothetical protein
VINLFIDVVFNREQVKIAENQLNTTKEQLGRTQQLVDAGSLPYSDLLDLQSQNATNQLNVINAKNGLRLAKLALAQALQIPFTENFDVIEPVYEVSKEALAAGTPAEIFEVSVALMPQIKAAEANVKSAEYGVKIAKGGFFGVGPGNSTQRNFLPESFSDMVYPIIIEEYGIFGGLVVIFLYLLFLWRSIVLFRRCPYAFGAFLAIGLSFTLVFQAMLNMAVGVNLVPVTGLTLPLISMGGSSVWFTSLTIGIVLSVSKYVEEMEGHKQKKDTITEQIEIIA